MIRTPPQHNTTNPPGQVVNLEVPLSRAIEDFQGDNKEYLIMRVRELQKELRYEREQRNIWYIEAMHYKSIVEKFTKYS